MSEIEEGMMGTELLHLKYRQEQCAAEFTKLECTVKPGTKKNQTAENLGASRPLDTVPRVEEVPLAIGTTCRN